MVCVERYNTIESAWTSWRLFAHLCGWDIPDAKSPPPSQRLRVVGADVDLSALPHGPLVIMIASDRVDFLRSELMEILRTGSLTSGKAASLHGRLRWSSTQLFGQLGRAKLRPFIRRQSEIERTCLNKQLISM